MQGRGSGKAAWMREALELQAKCAEQTAVIEAQGALIRDMQAEASALKRQIADHRPGRGKTAPPEFSYFQEVRRRSWMRRHRLIALVLAQALGAMLIWAWGNRDALRPLLGLSYWGAAAPL